MVSVVPSRFAGLKIEDDDDESQKQSKKTPNKQQTPTKADTNLKKQTKSNNGNKKLQETGAKKRSPKEASGNQEQWKEWKARDQEFVTECYEKDLEEAILQSKLQFEAESVCRKYDDKDSQASSSAVNSNKKKKKKPQSMNLHEFNQKLELANNVTSNKATPVPVHKESKGDDFFKNVDEATRNTLWKETRGPGTVVPIAIEVKSREVTTSESSSSSANSEELESLKLENISLKGEVEDLRQKLKKAAQIIKNAELKEKVELLREIQNLRKTQSAMSEEMSDLYVELEQEKSKIGASKGGTLKKNVRFDASTEVVKD